MSETQLSPMASRNAALQPVTAPDLPKQRFGKFINNFLVRSKIFDQSESSFKMKPFRSSSPGRSEGGRSSQSSITLTQPDQSKTSTFKLTQFSRPSTNTQYQRSSQPSSALSQFNIRRREPYQPPNTPFECTSPISSDKPTTSCFDKSPEDQQPLYSHIESNPKLKISTEASSTQELYYFKPLERMLVSPSLPTNLINISMENSTSSNTRSVTNYHQNNRSDLQFTSKHQQSASMTDLATTFPMPTNQSNHQQYDPNGLSSKSFTQTNTKTTHYPFQTLNSNIDTKDHPRCLPKKSRKKLSQPSLLQCQKQVQRTLQLDQQLKINGVGPIFSQNPFEDLAMLRSTASHSSQSKSLGKYALLTDHSQLLKQFQSEQAKERQQSLTQLQPKNLQHKYASLSTQIQASSTPLKKQALDEKHVLVSRVFMEMIHEPSHLTRHIKNLSMQPNQLKLLSDELCAVSYPQKSYNNSSSTATPQNVSGWQTPLGENQQSNIAPPSVLSTFKVQYNQFCSYMNDFSQSMQDKKNSDGTQKNNSMHIDSPNKFKTPAQTSLRNSIRASWSSHQNLTQMELYKVQMIESLLMNLQENFAYLVTMKQTGRKVAKALMKVAGNIELRQVLFEEEDSTKMKKAIDFRMGFVEETWKTVSGKNPKGFEKTRKMPVSTCDGTQYVPVEEAWQTYQMFQYFNQNLYSYIQTRLQLSENQKRNGLEKYIEDIHEMKANLLNKPQFQRKERQDKADFEKKIAIFQPNPIITNQRGQLVKRLEEMELHKGQFPFVGQLVRLKSQQIDQAFDIFKERPQL